jgi:hypothetical protein
VSSPLGGATERAIMLVGQLHRLTDEELARVALGVNDERASRTRRDARQGAMARNFGMPTIPGVPFVTDGAEQAIGIKGATDLAGFVNVTVTPVPPVQVGRHPGVVYGADGRPHPEATTARVLARAGEIEYIRPGRISPEARAIVQAIVELIAAGDR